MTSKRTTSWIIVLVVAVLAMGVLAGYFISKKGSSFFKNRSPYAAVYLETGDIYYGKIHSWPKLYLEEVWYLERDAEGKPQLAPYKDLFWGPGNKLYLNPDQVVWWTYLRADSELLSAFKSAAQ